MAFVYVVVSISHFGMGNLGILFAVTLAIVAIAVLLLGVQTFFSKRKKFPNMHVGGNKALNKKGIYCVQTQDAMARKTKNAETQGPGNEE